MANSENIINITVTGMTCEGCANTVRTALVATSGVTAADVDVATGLVKVHVDGTVATDDVEFAIDDAVTASGYTVAS
jgi:copper chaperone CopZ